MAGELQAIGTRGAVVYGLLRDASGLYWNTQTKKLEAYVPANYALYAIPLTEDGNTGNYTGSMPSAPAPASGDYTCIACTANGPPSELDLAFYAFPISWLNSVPATSALLLTATATVTNSVPPIVTGPNQQIERGTSEVWTVQVSSGGIALDLRGTTITALWKAYIWDVDSAALITKTSNAGIDVSNAANGTLVIPLLPTDTDMLPVGGIGVDIHTLAYGIKVFLGGTEVIVAEGTLGLLDVAVQAI